MSRPKDYPGFLAGKEPRPTSSGIDPPPLHSSLFPFQRAVTEWAIRRGTAGLFADTGLGKTRMQLEWLRVMAQGRGLIVAPLGVAHQTMDEAAALGIDIGYIPAPTRSRGLYITNYERLDRFGPADFDAVVLDESSILKSVDGKTRTKLIADWTAVPHRLCCTATPAPNDIEELANHAEFLGVCRRAEMLATYFVHDERNWRLKGHAREPFFRWLATWAMYLRKPSDLGFDDAGYELPPLRISEERVSVDWQPTDGHLFPALASGIQGRIVARKGSLGARVARAVELLEKSPDQALVWCGLNDEGRELARLLGSECVLIEGADEPGEKVAREQLWRSGEARVLISKPSIFGFGMNWQHCHRMVFLGIGDSWEQYYQAIRRCWRFGQRHPVEVSIIVSDAEHRIVENVMRKEEEAKMVAEETITAVASYERAELDGVADRSSKRDSRESVGDGWRLILGDCVDAVAALPDASVGLSVFSPPFAALYTYSDDVRDMGNCRDYEEFFRHFDFLIPGLLRVTQPGRRACVHVQQVTMTKTTHGVIGWFDFRADVVRHFVDAGWIYDGEVVVDKDPQSQAIRTKSKALLFVQKNKDSSWSRPAMADYILLFRAPGDNAEPIKNDVSNEEWILWARPIWYGIRESGTLQAAAARDEKDEKHIAPLQLETVERCVRLWSNPGDLVLDPFSGIGTTGFVALRRGRRFVGSELKESYYEQAIRNLRSATVQQSLADILESSREEK